jgi:Asp-tRNA(Asn)/Glu-tRNA(Gln) amidotransferase A subunit family amidase
MVKLPTGRISGRALRALVSTARKTPAKYVLAKVLRAQLGIDAARALGADARGDLPFSTAPLLGRCEHRRASQELGIPTTGDWPRTTSAYERAFAARRLPPEELVERAITAARDLAGNKPSLGPILDFDDARAIEAAYESKKRIADGKARSALEGIPIAIKEEVMVEGLPTRVGTGFLPATPAHTDCVPVKRLRDAGAVIIGTTPMTEYGMSPLGGNPHRVMPRNAHRSDHLPGGSSSGSGVAVATGVVPVALGADGGGSIRIPAALNGVFGLKPTYGRVPVVGHGVVGGSSVVHLGPIGASTHDLAVFLEATSGADPGDPSSLAQPPLEPGELVRAMGRGVRGLRIGVDDDEWARADPEVAKAGRTALAALESEGAVLVPIGVRLARHAAAIGYMTIGLEFFTNLAEVRRHHMDDLGSDLQLLLTNLETFAADDFLDSQRLRSELRREIAAILGDVDVLALPTTATTAPPVTDDDARDGFVDPPALDAMCRFAFIGNLTGIPGGTAPVGLSSAGLPIGLQILGDAWDEAAVLQVLAHLERIGVARVERPRSAVDLLDG